MSIFKMAPQTGRPYDNKGNETKNFEQFLSLFFKYIYSKIFQTRENIFTIY